ncbi:MAG: hypothetical protein GX612_09150 [Bacteroidales bacterium]|jgi:hypothetical protein|nr:hypothetical protein [Bacteroidales bacterium]
MTKKKTMWCVSITILVFAGAVAFYSCQKDQVLDNPKQEQVVKPVQKFPQITHFTVNGIIYEATAENWAIFEEFGGYYWYYDADGKKHWEWPSTGDPYWRPDVGENENLPNFQEPLIGRFVRHTIVDIMNAPIIERQNMVIDNMAEPYDQSISLSAKIDSVSLNKVITGEYIISNITETYIVNEDEITLSYLIDFLNPETDYTESQTVSFTYESGNEE